MAFQHLKGNQLFTWCDSNRTRGNGFKLKEGSLEGENFHRRSSEALEQAAQRSCGCPIPGGVQGQDGWGTGQPDLLADNSVYGRGVGSRWSLMSLAI